MYHIDVPSAIDVFHKEDSEFRHHFQQTSLDVCEMRDGCPKEVAAGKGTVLWKTVQFSSGYSEPRLTASSRLQIPVKTACLILYHTDLALSHPESCLGSPRRLVF